MKELSIEDKVKRYDEAIKKVNDYYEGKAKLYSDVDKTLDYLFPELKESEDEKIRKRVLFSLQKDFITTKNSGCSTKDLEDCIAWLEKQGKPQDKGEISDGYHTFNELYYYRMLYNAAFFNMLPKEWVHKSKRHNDGEECFGGGWFIVMANLPTGQISNHYELKDWDLFQIPEKEVADKWDGHTPQEAADRLHKYLLEKQGETFTKKDVDDAYLKGICDAKHELEKQGEQKPVIDFKASNWYVSKVDGKIHDMTYNPTDKVKPKFKVGDWVVKGDTIAQILDIQEQYYVGLDINGKDFTSSRFLNDDKIHLWTIQDVKDGDVLACGDKVTDCPFIFHNLTEELNPRSYCGVNMLQHFQYNDENGGFWCHSDEVRPATKEQRELLFKKMEEAGYTWNPDEKILEKIKSNQDLNEEDEKIRNTLIKICINALPDIFKRYGYEGDKKNIIDWLEKQSV